MGDALTDVAAEIAATAEDGYVSVLRLGDPPAWPEDVPLPDVLTDLAAASRVEWLPGPVVEHDGRRYDLGMHAPDGRRTLIRLSRRGRLGPIHNG